jgi:hypothetical protein
MNNITYISGFYTCVKIMQYFGLYIYICYITVWITALVGYPYYAPSEQFTLSLWSEFIGDKKKTKSKPKSKTK